MKSRYENTLILGITAGVSALMAVLFAAIGTLIIWAVHLFANPLTLQGVAHFFIEALEATSFVMGIGFIGAVVRSAAENPKSLLGKAVEGLWSISLVFLALLLAGILLNFIVWIYHRWFDGFLLLSGLVAFTVMYYIW